MWSPWIIAETWRVLTWRWAKQTDMSPAQWSALSRSANLMFDVFDEVYQLVHPRRPFPPAWPSLKDPDDRPVFAAAKLSGASVVVSLNTVDYPPGGSFDGIRYLSPRDFLAEIGWSRE